MADLLELLRDGSTRSYDGEAVTELEHALQCAALAAAAGADDELVTAALLHDLGRIPVVAARHRGLPHELAGAAEVADLPERVGWLVAHHVAAKRWLVAVEPSYEISEVSRASLRRQGGPAATAEVDQWARHPWWPDVVRLRRWDDAAKIPGLDVPGLEAYAALLTRPGPSVAAPR